MRKIIFVALAALAFAHGAQAAVSYTRTPAGTLIYSPINIDVSFDDFSDTNIPSPYTNFWGVLVDDGGEWSAAPVICYASTTLSANLDIDLPAGDYPGVWFVGGETLDQCNTDTNLDGANWGDPAIEYGTAGPNYSFTILAAASPSVSLNPIAVPTSTAPNSLGFVGSQIRDPGTLLVVVLAFGLPLTFYVIGRLIRLIPGKTKK